MSMGCNNSWDSCCEDPCSDFSTDCSEACECGCGNVVSRSPSFLLEFTPIIKDNNVAVAVGGGDAENEPCCEPRMVSPCVANSLGEPTQNSEATLADVAVTAQSNIASYINNFLAQEDNAEKNTDGSIASAAKNFAKTLIGYFDESFKDN